MRDMFPIVAALVRQFTSVDMVIEANQNVKAPSGAYASVLIAQSAQGRSAGRVRQEILKDGLIRYVTRYPVTWEVTVNFWRGTALESAAMLQRIQYMPSAHDGLLAQGIGLVGVSTVTNLTALQSSSQEQRAVTTITLTTYEEVFEDVNPIEHVSVRVEDDMKRVLTNISINQE